MENEIVNTFFDDSTHFRQLYLQGKYSELWELSKQEKTLENEIWGAYALFLQGKMKEAMAILEKIPFDSLDKVWLSNYYRLKGYVHFRNAEIDSALEYANKSFEIDKTLGESINIKKAIIAGYSMFSAISQNKGMFEKGLEEIQLSTKLAKEINDSRSIYGGHWSRSQLHWKLGQMEQANEAAVTALKYFREIEDKVSTARILFLLVISNSNLKRDIAKNYLKDLENIFEEATEDNIRFIQLAHDLAKGTYLKTSKRSREKIKAEEILVNLIEYNQSNIYYTLEAIPMLIELLLVEYQSYQENEVLEEIHQYLEKMTSVAKASSMIESIVKGKLIQAQLASIEGNFEFAEKIIESTLIMTEENNLSYFSNQIKEVKSKLENEFDEMQELTKKNVSFGQRLEKSNLINYLQQAQGLFQNEREGI